METLLHIGNKSFAPSRYLSRQRTVITIGRPGKIEVKPTKAYRTQTALVPGLGIAEPAVVSKSYPEYWDHLRHVGAVIDSKEADRA